MDSEEHIAKLKRIGDLMELDLPCGSELYNELVRLAREVEAYEKETYPIPPPTPEEAECFREDQERGNSDRGDSSS